MSWVKVEDGYWRDGKFPFISAQAEVVLFRMESFSRDNERGGLLWSHDVDAVIHSRPGLRRSHFDELLQVPPGHEHPFVEVTEDGRYRIYGYVLRNPLTGTERRRVGRPIATTPAPTPRAARERLRRAAQREVDGPLMAGPQGHEMEHETGTKPEHGTLTGTQSHERVYPVPVPVPEPSTVPPVEVNLDIPPPGVGGTPALAGYRGWLAELNAATGRHFRGDPKSAAAYRALRRDGWSEGDLLAVAKGVALSPHHRGENELGRLYQDPMTVLRSRQLETLRDLGSGELAGVPAPSVMPRGVREQMAVHEAWGRVRDELAAGEVTT